jgi:hypothetical protein
MARNRSKKEIKGGKAMSNTVSISTKKGIELAEFLRKQLCEYVSEHFDESEPTEALIMSYGIDLFYGNWILHEANILKRDEMNMEESIDSKLMRLKTLMLNRIEDKKDVMH